MGLLHSIKHALSGQTKKQKKHFTLATKGSRKEVFSSLNSFMGLSSIDERFYTELERGFIRADIPPKLSKSLVELVKKEAKKEKINIPMEVFELAFNTLVSYYKSQVKNPKNDTLTGPQVILVVGVNGVGKTTTIAKLANHYKTNGKKPLLVAADTFRAGAVDQLIKWGEEIQIPVVANPIATDPASVIFDGMKRAQEGSYEIVICDTAGRLQTKVNLMNELGKLSRVIQKVYPAGPHEVFLVIDASLGQNGLIQAAAFAEVVPVSGVVLTKMDGTSKGGICLAIAEQLHLPIRWIGVGEGLDDIEPFDIELFIAKLMDYNEKEES